jgi:PilZ domain
MRSRRGCVARTGSFSPVQSHEPLQEPMAHVSPVLDRRYEIDRSAGEEKASKRRHLRFELTLLGRFMRSNKQEYPCRSTDISVGGGCFMSPVAVDEGERIVAYIDELGGVEGTVVRTFDGGFAMKFAATLHKREKLAAQITWLINRAELEGMDGRRAGHERIASASAATLMRLPDEQEIEVTLQDVSISGASVITAARPSLGTQVALGKLRAIVVRYHPEGLGVQFVDIQNPDALRRYFG